MQDNSSDQLREIKIVLTKNFGTVFSWHSFLDSHKIHETQVAKSRVRLASNRACLCTFITISREAAVHKLTEPRS